MWKDKYNKLTKEQKSIFNKCKKDAKKYFNLPKGYVLHHKDTELMYKDIDRYIRWLPEDLLVMEKGEHTKLHMTGKCYMSEKGINKIRILHTGINSPMYGKIAPNAKKVRCLENNITYSSIDDAANKLNVCRASIRKCLSGKRNTAGGYHWVLNN